MRSRVGSTLASAVLAVSLGACTSASDTTNVAATSSPVATTDLTATEDLGIFAPAAGRILYVNVGADLAVGPAATDLNYEPGVWAVDPNGPSDTTEGPRVADDVVSTLVRLDIGEAAPPPFGCPVGLEALGWSSDGAELLVTRWKKCEGTYFVVHADGTETLVPGQGGSGVGAATAAISPDGSRVVFEAQGLTVVNIESGFAAKLPYPAGGEPSSGPLTFSPDGTQIAYTAGGAVWVVNANGSDAHEILANEEIPSGSQSALQWSPAGNRIAIGLDPGIYTFAPDGSDFTKAIADGSNPHWSPDGSQIAYTIGSGLAIADPDGSNVREFGFGSSGPWHPGESAEAAGVTTLANGVGVELVGDGLGAQTLNINAEEVNGKANGEFQVSDNVIKIDCADSQTDGVVILGGVATDGPDFAEGDLVALIIREGDPDSVALYANDGGAKSCTKLVGSILDHLLANDSNFVDVEDGYDIETG